MRRKLNKKKKKQQIGISVDTLSYFSLSLLLEHTHKTLQSLAEKWKCEREKKR